MVEIATTTENGTDAVTGLYLMQNLSSLAVQIVSPVHGMMLIKTII